MVRTINNLRWRLARLVAPDPILAKPSSGGGPAILLSNPDYPYWYGWVIPRTLEVTIEHEPYVPVVDPLALATYVHVGPTGTITGTI